MIPFGRWGYIRWPMLYGNEEFVANGTMLDVTVTEWRMAGPVPVRQGMYMNVWVLPQNRPEGLVLEGAPVLWVKGLEFGLDIRNLDPADRQWLMPFLRRRLDCLEVLRAA